MGKTKKQQQAAPKVNKITKVSLQSPFFTYFESMPSKNSKDFLNSLLPNTLQEIAHALEQKSIEPS